MNQYRNRRTAGIALGVLLLLAGAAAAADMKIAYVDAERIFAESEPGKAGMKTLNGYEAELTKALDAKNQEIKDLEKTLQQQAFTLSPSARSDREEELRRAKIDLKRMAEDADRDLNGKQKEFLEKIDREVMVIIQQMGKELGYSMIFSKLGAALLYADPTSDITDEVIRRYNESKSSAD
ncbi:OmpH family outer membrane protein [bacterium]|nr:OmpH family outer membrane protein [candidate division CSSED10-310 bacterium]